MVVHSILLRCLAQDEKCVKAVSLCFHLWHCLIQSVFDFSIEIDRWRCLEGFAWISDGIWINIGNIESEYHLDPTTFSTKNLCMVSFN